MVYDNRGKRRFFLKMFTGLGGKKLSASAMDHFMRKDPPEGCEGPVERLHDLYERAVLTAPKYLEELYTLAKEDRPLSERWYHTYNG